MSEFEIIVIGGGHAGVEAACAASRLGVRTLLVTLRKAGIGQMSCNPAIGGLGKGQLVKEVDALGGVMGRAIDRTGIQFRTLNASKGPAVRASRAQADRDLYRDEVGRMVASQPHISVLEGEVRSIHREGENVAGIVLADGSAIACRALVITTGTFLRGLMHTGVTQTPGGRVGDSPAASLSSSLAEMGFSLGRLKTGTPPRLSKKSINFSTLLEQPGEIPARPFSIMTKEISQPQISCWITATSERTHEIIRANREHSPIFNGQIKSGGPRYCPSIEDKVYRFADKTQHQIFLEPEGYDSDLVYPNGISTSLPTDVQEEFVRTIVGLENVKIVQHGYAVEYDFVDPRSLRPTLETKLCQGLFLAGQINGTSGYEEAAAQGIIAGANAALKILDKDALIIDRGQGYIGVMIDDLITNGVDEPYRMFTSRAEYRLVLREDNASRRLTPLGMACGLVTPEQSRRFEESERCRATLMKFVSKHRVKPTAAVNQWLTEKNSALLKDSITIDALVRRPEISLHTVLQDLLPEGALEPEAAEGRQNRDLLDALETELKFAGYLSRQEEDIRKLKRSEGEYIPDQFNYDSVPGLRIEALEKLKRVKPYSLGQAMRIPGVTPSTISLLAVYLKRFKETQKKAA